MVLGKFEVWKEVPEWDGQQVIKLCYGIWMDQESIAAVFMEFIYRNRFDSC